MLVRTRGFSSRMAALAVAAALPMMVPWPVAAQGLTPKLPDLTGVVADRDWAIVLGKALFWDTGVGSDGMACASCHFHAGADARITNALSPGLLVRPEADLTFGAIEAQAPFALGQTASGTPADSNHTLVEEDFPFHRLADPSDRNSSLLITTDDVASSSGAYAGTFTRVHPRQPGDRCDDYSGEVFHAGVYPARQVEPRNTPSMINAVFNRRNFWDGRASNTFSGAGVFGFADVENNPRARIVVLENGEPELRSLELEDASLASLAVGPPLSDLEMSCALRNFADLGRKLLSPARRALAQQAVDPQDSTFGTPGRFGSLRHGSGQGLANEHKYRDLVERAFDSKYWSINGRFTITEDGGLVRGGPDSYTQMEINFPMFWGIAVMLYGSTLVSDQSPFDLGQMSEAAARGETVFRAAAAQGGGGCAGCHGGALFSQAAVPAGQDFGAPIAVNNRPDGTGATTPALRDRGFFNIGVRPVAEDVGLGGTDPYGGPLSLSRQSIADGTNPNGVTRTIVDGSFKVPILRNVALTPPYFHNGGVATLRQALQHYRRGGSHRDLIGPGITGDDSGTGLLGEGLIPVPGADKGSNAGGALQVLTLSDGNIDDLIEFLKALTDERVQCDRAPFDHPELSIPTGHLPVDANNDGKADDEVFVLPAVGADGYAPESGLCIPNAGDLFAPGMDARVGG